MSKRGREEGREEEGGEEERRELMWGQRGRRTREVGSTPRLLDRLQFSAVGWSLVEPTTTHRFTVGV
jgi:hypothetical protein